MRGGGGNNIDQLLVNMKGDSSAGTPEDVLDLGVGKVLSIFDGNDAAEVDGNKQSIVAALKQGLSDLKQDIFSERLSKCYTLRNALQYV